MRQDPTEMAAHGKRGMGIPSDDEASNLCLASQVQTHLQEHLSHRH